MSLERNHFLAGEAIFKKLYKAIDNKSQDKLDEMDVDKLIAALERVSKIQRASVGIDGKGGSGDEAIKNTSVEVIMRRSAEAEGRLVESDEFDMTLLSDPETLKAAQELIIKVNK